MLESGQAALEGLDMGEGAERHELVLCKFQGYVCVDYKGMMYRMVSREPERHLSSRLRHPETAFL